MNKRLILTFLVIASMFFGLVLTPTRYSPNIISNSEGRESSGLIEYNENELGIKNGFALSQDTKEGIINPVLAEQSGWYDTGGISARTDAHINDYTDIPIDNESSWVASNAKIELWNLNREYAENGTFDQGIGGNQTYPDSITSYPDGWDVDWYDSSGGLQNLITYYDNSSDYVTIENQGEEDALPSITYWHYHNTWNLWNQTIKNEPYSDNMTLSFSYNYLSGVIDAGIYAIDGTVLLVAFIENSTYSDGYIVRDLMTETPARNAWNDVVFYNITNAPSEFVFSLGLYVFANDYDSFELNPGGDYDNDGAIDGDNTRVFKVQIDDVSLISQTPPTQEEVDLRFHAGEYNTTIVGSGEIYTSVLENQYWNDSFLTVGVSANVSISFDYEVWLLQHFFSNSSWTSHPTNKGVTYSIDVGQSADLSTFTYIGSDLTSTFENFSVYIFIPPDWDNATVYDPFINDVTSSCSLQTGTITIPTSLLTRLGWWKIDFESPNYAKDTSAQIYETGVWTGNSLFRPGNQTRLQVELGTASETPGIGSAIEIDWIMPNGTTWSTDSISSIISGIANSSSLTLGGINTTAGLWEVQAFWNNGTEIAYGVDTFDLYHQASAIVQYPSIETDYGNVIANQIVLADTDNGEYLLDGSVSMSANWSSTTIDFTPNFAKNWWHADFDTALIENGFFTVIVNITRSYFDPITVQFTVISTFATSLTITNAGPAAVENDLFDVFKVQLDYQLWNGTGIAGALPTVTHTGPQEGIEWNSFVDSGNGLYSIDIISNVSTTYEITITLSKAYHYNASDSFTLVINEISTNLVLVNGTADVVQYGDSYRLVVEYKNSTGYGLTGANLQVVTITPSTGLTNGSFTHITGGFYEITFAPLTTGTYAIVLSAELFNHETQYATFTLTGVVIPTVLTSLPSSVSITVNQTFILQLRFEDGSHNPINAGTIELIDTPSGITVSTATPAGVGLYNITIRASKIDIYNLLFRASATNYQSSIVGFSVSVTALPTTLEITNAGSIVESGLNEVFTVQLSYELMNGTGVPGALPALIVSGPAKGLLWYNFNDSDNGVYSIDIVCNVSATYGITITMSKQYYYNTTDSFTLIIGETGSHLDLLNGTADVVLFSNSYRLVVEYSNSTGYGLAGADVLVVTVTPVAGLVYTNFSHITDGYYEITLTPSAAGTFSLVISANITNHETQYATFTLTASGIPTILTSLPSEYTVAINQTYTLQLRFMDESLNPIDTAIITLINPPTGLSFSIVTTVGSGYYNITLESLTIQTFDLLFRATADNYQSSSAGFTFDVTEIQTRLDFGGDISSALVEFAEPFNLVVYYNSSNPGQAVQGANITVLPAVAELDFQVTEYIGYYIITIRGQGIGSWILSIIANKTNYRIATKQFSIEVREIDTAVEGSSPLETLLVDRTYDFTFSYNFESNSSNIHGATVVPSGSASNWVTYIELGSGQYSINLTPQELGEHSVLLTFEKVGFASLSYRLTFNVSRIPLAVEVLQGLSGLENVESIVIVRITEIDTGNHVSGLVVFGKILDSIGAQVGDSIALAETSTPGAYSGSIMMPVAEGEYRLQIICEGSHHVMNADYIMGLSPERSLSTMLFVTTTRYYPVIIAFAALGVGLVYRRSARKKRIRENKSTLAIKKRFDDIRNLLGVIVLHKESGLPVYSKILRDGLEETVISAFITAITSFRGEFDIESSSEEWGLIPISDIVRVISTNKLVCAFITTGNPSPEQRERMIQFAKTVAFIFDDTMEEVPIVVLDHHTTQQFNSLFEDLLDGQLLRTYKLDEVKKFPTTSCADERIARKHGEEFKLEDLASEIASCGLEEGRVYKAIMDALENHYLITTDDSPFATELLRAPDTISEEG